MPQSNVIDVSAVGDGLCVHNLFQSNMVLQRDKPIRVWGWASPGEAITVSFADQEKMCTAAKDRSWSVTLAAQKVQTKPSTMTITGTSNQLTFENILVGDVWLLGGQSNMEFPLERVDNGWLEIVSARFRDMRILTVPAQNGPEVKKSFPRLHEWSSWFGRHFRKGDWDVCSPKVARELSAIGYVFARRIHMATGVPIGVIDVSRGGTTVETWTPDAVLRSIDTAEVRTVLEEWDEKCATWDAQKDLEQRVRAFEKRVRDKQQRGEEIPADWKVPDDLKPGPLADQNRPSNCYNSMIAPIQGLAVKGAIFHQGYNNAFRGAAGVAMYYQVFSKMITAWRAAFDNPDMPFGIISLCTDGKPQTRENYVEHMLNDGIYIREAQYQTFLDFANAGDLNIGFASSFDKRRSWYHPQLKIPIGERIARWALATQYGMERQIRWKPPTCTKMEVTSDGKIKLHMDRAVAAEDSGAAIVGFAIAGEDRRFHPAEAEWWIRGVDARNRPQRDRKVLVLSSPHVPAPVHYRYAWGRNPLANLQSADHNDLPFATQRSDRWKIEDVPKGVLGDERIEGGKLNRRQRNRILGVLRKEDLQRRLAEARALLEKHAPQPKK